MQSQGTQLLQQKGNSLVKLLGMIYLFNKVLTEHVLCARHSSRCWQYSSEQNRQNLCPLRAYILLEATDGEQIIKNIFLLMIKANKEGSGIESVNSEHNVENLDGLASGGLLEKVTFE